MYYISEAVGVIRGLMEPRLIVDDMNPRAEKGDERFNKWQDYLCTSSRAARRAIRRLDKIGDLMIRESRSEHGVDVLTFHLRGVMLSAGLALSFSANDDLDIEVMKKSILLKQAFLTIMECLERTECLAVDPRTDEEKGEE